MLDFSNNVIADHIRVRYIQVRKSNNAEEFDAFSVSITRRTVYLIESLSNRRF